VKCCSILGQPWQDLTVCFISAMTIARGPREWGANAPGRNDGALTMASVENGETARELAMENHEHVGQSGAKWARTWRKTAGGISSFGVARRARLKKNTL
jgi:hypothetical protein